MIRNLLLVWAGLAVVLAFNSFRISTGAAHEIQGMIFLLIATVAALGVGVIEEIKKCRHPGQ